MEFDPERLIAWMEDALADRCQKKSAPLVVTTTYSPATLYTQSTTPSWIQDWQDAREQLYTSLPSPVSSAPTSSNTQRSEESLSYNENPFSEDGPTWIMKAMHDLGLTLANKNADYRIDGEFSNFEQAAKAVTQLTGSLVDTEDAIALQIGIKMGRLEGLPRDPRNESRLDTYKDLAGYAIILYAYAMSQAEEVEDK